MKFYVSKLILITKIFVLLWVGCSEDNTKDEVAEGIFGIMGDSVSFATEEQKQTFERGREVLLHRFTEEEGLGPHFNVTFCGSCHERPVVGGGAGRYRDFLLVSQQLYGTSIPTSVNGIQPQFHTEDLRHETDPATNHTAKRNPIPFFGVGLLAEIPEEEILSRADAPDEDGDGISGRPNYDRGFVGRFGRKSQTVSLEGFVRGPLFNHAGITSFPLSEEKKRLLPIPSPGRDVAFLQGLMRWVVPSVFAQAAAPDDPIVDDDDVPDPELSEDALFDLISFVMLLAAPEPDPLNAQSRAGKDLFTQIDCTGCHVPALRGPRGLIPAYTDLLLHDMGDELADGVMMGVAIGSEFRTAPLWGVAATGPYLHDGRADTLRQAILAHGGEALGSRDRFEALSEQEQSNVIAFLDSLGGSDQKSEGLLPPNTPLALPDELGGPLAELAGEERARFLRGRDLFDRDVFLDEGLGNSFNGDSCRACHFEPVMGGAGPQGVNVIRYGFFDEQGVFVFPPTGTMAARHQRSVSRSEPMDPTDEQLRTFEVRQTPALFGLGRIEQVPEEEILANEDPEDENQDGIRGVAHRLPSGILGRFGWKASIPSAGAFTRDALSNEIGITLPEVSEISPQGPESQFGLLEDDDGILDPEFLPDDVESLTFFMQQLAPPPAPERGAAFDEGLALFEEVGCAHCHVPFLRDAEGAQIWLYSDLLLHDVAAPDYKGVAEGQATHRQFRTPPLWGITHTAPYMHDGKSVTLQKAIEAHHTEAATAKHNFQALSPTEKIKLLQWMQAL